MKDLLSLSKEEIKNFFNSFDTVLTDVDGVLLDFEVVPIPGTVETIRAFKKHGKSVFYASNNSLSTPKYYEIKLKAFDAKVEEVIIPMMLAVEYLKKINFDKKIFTLNFEVVRRYLESEGFKVAEKKVELLPEIVDQDLVKIVKTLDPEVGAVLVGLDANINYASIQKAVFYLSKPDVLFLCGSPDEVVPQEEGMRFMGPGVYLKLLQEVSERESIIFGKPNRRLYDYLVEKCNLKPERTLFIGDSLKQDVKFGNDFGFISLLVLTGLNTVEDAVAGSDDLKPDFYINSLADLNGLFEYID